MTAKMCTTISACTSLINIKNWIINIYLFYIKKHRPNNKWWFFLLKCHIYFGFLHVSKFQVSMQYKKKNCTQDSNSNSSLLVSLRFFPINKVYQFTYIAYNLCTFNCIWNLLLTKVMHGQNVVVRPDKKKLL